jgi:hypothetical protein
VFFINIPTAVRMMIDVKLARTADQRRSRQVLGSAPGVQRVTQAFEGETDPDLALLYLLEVDAPDVTAALRHLRSASEIEYAEEAPLRGPV